MNQEELSKYRALYEQCRRLRRHCELLEAELAAARKGQSAAAQAFEAGNVELFAVIHRNYAAHSPRAVVFEFPKKSP